MDQLDPVRQRLALLRRKPRQPWLVFLLYLVAALYLTAPIHSAMTARFIGAETGDTYRVVRHVWWFKTAILNGDDIFEQSLLAYAEGFRAVRLWANPLQFFPMWLFAFFLPLPAAFNAGVLLTLTLNGWSMYALARRKLTGSGRFPPFIAGLVFIFFPTLQGYLLDGRIGMLALWPLPLLILYLFDYADLGGRRRLFFTALFFMLVALGDTMRVLYVLAPLSVLFVCARVQRRDQLGALRATFAVFAGCVFLLLYLSPVMADLMDHPQLLAADGRQGQSIDLLGLASPSFANAFWDNIATHSQRVLGSNLSGSASYIGVIGGFVALLGVLFRREARWCLLVCFTAWILALGPVLRVNDQVLVGTIGGYPAVLPLPFAILARLPAFELAQSPANFMGLFAAMYALLVGFGTALCCTSNLLQRRGPYAQIIIAGVFVFLLLEDFKLVGDFPSVPADVPREILNLRRQRDIRAVYNVPYDNPLAVNEALYLQTAHAKPLIAGHDVRITTVDRARLALLAKFQPSLLQDAGADIVIINKARALESGQLDLLHWRARQSLGEPLYEDQRYAVYETPAIRDRAPAVYAPVNDAQSHVTYIYKEQPGWLEYSAVLEAQNRLVHLSLNDTPLETLLVNGRIPLAVPLPLAWRGYHTFRVAPDPPCPERVDTTLLNCQRVKVEDVQIKVLSDGAIYDPIRIEDGIILAGYLLAEAADGELIRIRLWWQFVTDRSEKDVRFVHVLDVKGRLVPGSPPDHHFGALSAGSEVTETVSLDRNLLKAGEYRVLTGWYQLPQAIRYDVLTEVEGAQDDTVVLGTIRINE